MLLIPACIVDAAEGRLSRRRPADHVITGWIWVGRDTEQRSGRGRSLRQLSDRVEQLAYHRRCAVLVSADLAAALAASGHAIGGQLAVWAVLGAIIEAAVGVRRIRREIGGRRARVRILSTRSNDALAWRARGLIGVHRMATEEAYRKEIAKRLS